MERQNPDHIILNKMITRLRKGEYVCPMRACPDSDPG